MLSKIWAFIKRDALQAVSYKMGFVGQFFGIFFGVATFFFISKVVGTGAAQYLTKYRGDYFAFAIVGMAFNSFLGVGLSSLAGIIRREQLQGTLEAMLVTRTPLSLIIFSSALWNFGFTSFRVLVYVLTGYFLFGMNLNFSLEGLLAGLLILLVTLLSFMGIGMISASFILIFKEGNPLDFLMGASSGLLGGVFYPIAVLPLWLQPFSKLLPITYGIEGFRKALLVRATFQDILPELSVLTIFLVILLPLGLISFSYAVKYAKKEGTLVHY